MLGGRGWCIVMVLCSKYVYSCTQNVSCDDHVIENHGKQSER